MQRKLSATLLILICFATLTPIFLPALNAQPENPTITISADGSVTGTNKISRNGNTYTLTENLNTPITIKKDNIVLNGNNHTLIALDDATNNQTAISFEHKTRIVISGLTIESFEYAIQANNSAYCKFSGNTINTAKYGIVIKESQNMWITNNVIEETSFAAVQTSNTQNILISNNTIQNNFGYGVTVDETSDSVKTNCVISANLFKNNSRSTDFTFFNIVLGLGSSYNTIIGNIIANAPLSNNGNFNTITKNTISDCAIAIWGGGKNCTYTENNFIKNRGVYFSASIELSNVFYLNNFVDNTYLDMAAPISYEPTGPSWDNGTVGNYYSDYLIQNPDAQEIPGTGTYNTPYNITETYSRRFHTHTFFDNHPLVKPVEVVPPQTQVPEWAASIENPAFDFTTVLLIILGVALVVLLLIVLVLFRRLR